MTLEEHIVAILNPLFNERVWFDVAPDETTFDAAFALLEIVGGRQEWNIDPTDANSHRHARVRITGWALDRLQASALSLACCDIVRLQGGVTEPYGAPTSIYDHALKMPGFRWDFGIWHQFDP